MTPERVDRDDTIQRMTADDIPAVRVIEIEGNLSPWSEEAYSDEVVRDDSVCLTLKCGRQIKGFLVARLITNNQSAELFNLGIENSNKRHGKGSQLLGHFLRLCKTYAVKEVWLEVRESNNPAISLYKKHGFTPISMRKNFYTNPNEDAILMKKDII